MKVLGQQGLDFIATKFKELSKNKVEKVEGKGLSTKDYTNEAKTKVDKIPDNFKYIQHIVLTQDEYNALSSTQKADTTVFYYIKK